MTVLPYVCVVLLAAVVVLALLVRCLQHRYDVLTSDLRRRERMYRHARAELLDLRRQINASADGLRTPELVRRDPLMARLLRGETGPSPAEVDRMLADLEAHLKAKANPRPGTTEEPNA